MAEFAEVARASDIAPGAIAIVKVGESEIALANVNGQFYAVQNECTHAQGPMGEGEWVDEYNLECPWHGSMFDIRTGETRNPPATEPLKTYEVKVEDGVVKVAI